MGGGGIKDMLSPPCQNMGGDTSPPSPQDLRRWNMHVLLKLLNVITHSCAS